MSWSDNVEQAHSRCEALPDQDEMDDVALHEATSMLSDIVSHLNKALDQIGTASRR